MNIILSAQTSLESAKIELLLVALQLLYNIWQNIFSTLAPTRILHWVDLFLKIVGEKKWKNSITISMYNVYKISIEFFSLECWG